VKVRGPVAFVTCRDVPVLPLGDRLALAALKSLGVASRVQVWDDPAVAWQAARARTEVSPSLYARVDGLEKDGRFLLAELELIEPELFLERKPGAAERFARALLGALAR